jgi:metal-sulfur cluster biosynthetic enzyme
MMRAMNAPAPPDESVVRDALATVVGPEAGMNIIDLGLVYRVESGPAGVVVDMTMTTPACPVADMLVDEARSAVAQVAPPGTPIDVRLVWDPIWNPSMMSGVAKDHFGWV